MLNILILYSVSLNTMEGINNVYNEQLVSSHVVYFMSYGCGGGGAGGGVTILQKRTFFCLSRRQLQFQFWSCSPTNLMIDPVQNCISLVLDKVLSPYELPWAGQDEEEMVNFSR